MNQVYLMGNVGNIDIKTISSGKKVASITLATSETYNDEKKTTWHNIKGWGWIADLPIEKGSEIIVFGKLQVDEYTDKDGNKKYFNHVLAHTIKVAQRLTPMKGEAKGTSMFPDDGNLPF